MGRIGGAWGLRGHFKVELHTDNAERFAPGHTLYLQGRPARVVESRRARGLLIVKLDLVTNRTQVESLRGVELTIPSSELGPLPPSTYYHYQIVGVGVWTEGGDLLGRLEEILTPGANDVYLVRNGDGREVLVPALKDVILELDLQERRMVVRLPEGLG